MSKVDNGAVLKNLRRELQKVGLSKEQIDDSVQKAIDKSVKPVKLSKEQNLKLARLLQNSGDKVVILRNKHKEIVIYEFKAYKKLVASVEVARNSQNKHKLSIDDVDGLCPAATGTKGRNSSEML